MTNQPAERRCTCDGPCLWQSAPGSVPCSAPVWDHGNRGHDWQGQPADDCPVHGQPAPTAEAGLVAKLQYTKDGWCALGCGYHKPGSKTCDSNSVRYTDHLHGHAKGSYAQPRCELAAYASQQPDAVAVLREVEWSYRWNGEYWHGECPSCGQLQPHDEGKKNIIVPSGCKNRNHGHAKNNAFLPDCRLAAALRGGQ